MIQNTLKTPLTESKIPAQKKYSKETLQLDSNHTEYSDSDPNISAFPTKCANSWTT
jgi:hypothetical protein